jgi:hypothetical protein
LRRRKRKSRRQRRKQARRNTDTNIGAIGRIGLDTTWPVKIKSCIVTDHPQNPLVIAEETDHATANETGIAVGDMRTRTEIENDNDNEGVYEIKTTNVIEIQKEREIGQGGVVTVMAMMSGGKGGEAEAAHQEDMKDTSGSPCP